MIGRRKCWPVAGATSPKQGVEWGTEPPRYRGPHVAAVEILLYEKDCEHMKQYRVDELRPKDYERIKGYLDKHFGSPQMEGVYWVPLDPDLFDQVQAAHVDCQPFYFAVVLEPTVISFELLIRTRKRIRCDCIHYANEGQRDYIIAFADSIFERLKILT